MEGEDDMREEVDMEDEIDDLEEVDPDEELAVGEEMSSVLDYEPPKVWTQRPSARRFGLSKSSRVGERKWKDGTEPKPWMVEPDVLGYLNTFRHLNDSDRLRLARACANYLNHKERQRVGYFEKRREAKTERKRSRAGDSKRFVDDEAIEEEEK